MSCIALIGPDRLIAAAGVDAAANDSSLYASNYLHVRVLPSTTATSQNHELLIEVTIDPQHLPMQTVSAGGQVFTRIDLGEGPQSGGGFRQYVAGAPEVPVIHRLIAIDPTQTYVADVQLIGRTTYGGITLMPVQPDAIDKGGPRPIVWNRESYNVNRELGGNFVALGAVARLGTVTVLPLTLAPLRYNPARQEVTVWRKMLIRLRGSGRSMSFARDAVGHPQRVVLTPFVATQVRGLVVNAAEVFATASSLSDPRMLILSSEALLPEARKLARGERLARFDVEVAGVGPTPTAASIKALIAANYARGGLDSVLLFGDHKNVPLYQFPDAYVSDWGYAIIDGNDNFADIGIGRIAVADIASGAVVLAKLATYERLQRAGHRSANVLLIAHSEEYPGKYTANQEAVRLGANPRHLRYATQYGGEQASNASVTTAIDKGPAIVAYRGHGSDTAWYDWDKNGASFDLPQVDALTNASRGLAVVINVACATGALEYVPVSMAQELMLRQGQGAGAIAVIAATDDSYTDVNSAFNLYLFGGLESQRDADLGSLLSLANNRLITDHNGVMIPNVEMYMLFGDPTLRPWLR